MTVSQTEFDALKVEVASLKKLIGAAYLEAPQPTFPGGATDDLLKADFFAKWAVKANELPSGRLPLGIGVTETNFILHDQRVDIDALKTAVAAIPAGGVGPKGDKGDIGPRGPAGGGTATGIGDIAGFGYGCHLVAGTFEALIFVQGPPDNALRVLTNHKANGDGGFTHADKKLGQQRIDIEQFGVGVSYWTPLENQDGTPFQRNALDKKGGKGIILRNHSDDNHRAPYAQIYTGLPGQGLQIGVSSNKTNVMDQPTIQIEPDGTKSIG